MARLLFPDEGSRLTYRVSGTTMSAAPGVAAVFYTDAAATTLADVRAYDGTATPGAALAGSSVTTDAYSRMPLFWGPDGVDTLYAVVSGGPISPVHARHDERLDALDTRIVTAPARTSTAYTTASLAAGEAEQGLITMARGYRVLTVQTSAPARVRLYTTAAKRAADLARAVGVDPAADAGVVLDYVTTGSATAALSPLVDGVNLEATPVAQIPVTVTNLGTAAAAIAVTLTWIGTE